jgi:hypothetical protein
MWQRYDGDTMSWNEVTAGEAGEVGCDDGVKMDESRGGRVARSSEMR